MVLEYQKPLGQKGGLEACFLVYCDPWPEAHPGTGTAVGQGPREAPCSAPAG